MKPQFLADADFNHKIIAGLRRRDPSIDFRTAEQGAIVGRSDAEVLRIAARSGRILVSHDRRTMPACFVEFIATRESPGLIIVPQHLEIGAAIDDLLLIAAVTTQEEWRNVIGFLPL